MWRSWLDRHVRGGEQVRLPRLYRPDIVLVRLAGNGEDARPWYQACVHQE